MDPINPDYYKSKGGLEKIDVIEAFLMDKPYRWAPLDYLIRAGKKPDQDEVQDLRKAIWWIEREIAAIERRAAIDRQRQAKLQAHVAEVANRFPEACPDLDQEYPPSWFSPGHHPV